MRKNITTITKIFLAVFLAVEFLHFTPKAQAQVPTLVNDPPLTSIAGGMATQLGLISAGVGLPGVSSGIISGVDAAVDTACRGVAKAEEVASTADNFSTFSFIGGGGAESAQITAKLAALIAVKTCREAQLEVYKKTPVTSLLIGQELIRKQEVLNAELNSLSSRIENLRARQAQTAKEVLKALGIKLVLNYSQRLTTALINKMVNKYKISNYLRYADAVGTQIYTKDYINKNYTSNQDKMILGSMISSDVSQNKILPMVRLQAEESLGFIPQELDVSDPDYYAKLAKAGTGEANPYFMQTVFNDRLQQAKTTGQTQAQSEISSGNGFIPVRNCTNAIDQQNAIELRHAQAAKNLEDNTAILNRLMAQYTVNPGNSQTREEMEKAAAEVSKSKQALNAVPKEVSDPIINMCEGITNPAGFVNNGIASLLTKQVFESANIKESNIPFWGQFLYSVADNLINNIIEGNRPNVNLLVEDGFRAVNVLSQDVIRLTGDNGQLGAGGSAAAPSSPSGAGGVGGAAGAPLACGGNYTSLQACISGGNDENYCNAICGSVQGAYTINTQVNIRGSLSNLQIR